MAEEKVSYEHALKYWSSVPPTVDGVLGGFGNSVVPRVDVIGSQTFIRRLGQLSPNTFPNGPNAPREKTVLDVGAGIGRVTKNLLSKYGTHLDLLELTPSLVEQAKKDLADTPGVRNYYIQGMQDFTPTSDYWLVWCQWCLGQLPTPPLIEFLQRMRKSLQLGGIIIVKENNSTTEDLYDDEDSSLTRTDASYRAIFEKAGLRLLLTALQKGLPSELFPVRMYALASMSLDELARLETPPDGQ